MLIALIKKLIGWSIFFIILILIMDQIAMPLYVRHSSQTILPNVIGKHYAAAKKNLESKGFEIIRAGETVNTKYPPGTVVQQSPEQKSIVKKGRRIYVTLSTPEKPITIPNVIGQSERDANIILTSSGLAADSTVIWEYSPLYPEGVVCNQSMYEGTQTHRGMPVRLTISLGPIPREVEVPDFKFKNLGFIERSIGKKGLTIGEIIRLPNDEYLPNTILRQSPEPGTMVLPGDSVNLVISVLDTFEINHEGQ